MSARGNAVVAAAAEGDGGGGGGTKVTVLFNTARFGVKVADGAFDARTTIGNVHARLRRKLAKGGGAELAAVMTYVFVRNGTEAFVPASHQTLGELADAYATSRDARTLALTIDTQLFSG